MRTKLKYGGGHKTGIYSKSQISIITTDILTLERVETRVVMVVVVMQPNHLSTHVHNSSA